jgi:enterochelin esterase-like enzyme
LLALALVGCRSERSTGEAGVAVAATPVLASAQVSAQAAAAGRLPAQELTWEFGATAVGPMVAVVSVPAHTPGQKFPVLVAMHGRGEAFKGPARGARGWMDDYALPRAIERLEHPPLVRADFGGEVAAERLALLNQSLERTPYAGLIVVCPYTPDILAGERAFSAAVPLAQFIVDELLPRVFRDTPALTEPAHVGIDGVSLGGRAALLAGFERPKSFGVVASLQAAIDASEVRPLVVRAMRARTVNPRLGLRLVTSDRDYFVREIEALSSALSEAEIEHSFVRVRGDHSYEFNRGPGALEMLSFHDRALRGKPTL